MNSRGLGKFESRAMTSSPPAEVIFVVEDDVSVRESLESLLMSAGRGVKTFSSAEEFLACERPLAPSCLLLDISLPRLSGLDLQAHLATGGAAASMPIIFITAFGDVPTSVRAMKAGAAEFLTKPFDQDALLDAVDHALERSRVAVAQEADTRVLRRRYATLSLREREVMRLVTRGVPNKLVAAELGISEVTVKVHRGRAMRKMQAPSLPHLVLMAERVGAFPLTVSDRWKTGGLSRSRMAVSSPDRARHHPLPHRGRS